MGERVDRLLDHSSLAKPLLCTFHSFCVRILRRDIEALKVNGEGLTRSFAIYDENDQQAIVKQIMRRMGYDISGIDKPETLYDPNDPTRSRYVTDVVRDPVTHQWAHRNVTNEPIPPGAQSWVPSTQLKIPRPDPVTSVTGGSAAGGPFFQGHRDKQGNWVADVDAQGHPVYAPMPMVETPGGPTGRQYEPRLPGTAVPLPQSAPKTAHEIEQEAGDAAAERALSQTSQDPSQRDPLYAQEVLSTMKLPDNIKTLAMQKLKAEYQGAGPDLKFAWDAAHRKRSKPKTQPPPAAPTGAQPAATPAAPAKVKILD